MLETVPVFGLDWSGFRPQLNGVYENGARFIIRYSAGYGRIQNPATHFKLCQPGEVADAIGAGLDFIANSEWYETRVTEGSGAGAQDGAADLAFWQSMGLALGASIYVSWDTTQLSSQWDGVAAYLSAYDGALQGNYHVDLYAGTPAIREMLRRGVIRYGWRANAGSWSNDGLPYQPSGAAGLIAQAQAATPAAIWQTGNYWYGKSADENLLIRPNCGSHLQALSGGGALHIQSIPAAPNNPGFNPFDGSAFNLAAGHYYGIVTGPAISHGGAFVEERAPISLIQRRLQQLGFAPAGGGWADGIFEQPTVDAVAAWQHSTRPDTTHYGQVWADDWAALFSDPTQNPPPAPADNPPAGSPAKIWQAAAWPAQLIPAGEYFGLITGPAASHGGFFAAEKQYVKMIQQRLINCGFVPGVTDPGNGWADGVFEQPTADAVAAFQRIHIPAPTAAGQVWPADWSILFNL